MLTKQQLDERLNYVTGSDAASICEKSPYKSMVKLWLEKTRRAEAEDISNANHIKFGNYFEEGVARWFQAESGILVNFTMPSPRPILIHPEHSWMAGTIDFNIIGENAILECKTALKDDEWGDAQNVIPEHYLFQVAHYCAVGGFDRAYIAVVFTMTRELRWYIYDRNPALEEKLIQREYDFWHNYVLKDVAPTPKDEDDILALYRKPDPNPIIATDEIESYVYAYKGFNGDVAGLEEEKGYMRDRIAVYMGNHDSLLSASGEPLVSWRFIKSAERFDTVKFKKDNPEMYKKYIKPEDPNKPSRQFRILTKGDI